MNNGSYTNLTADASQDNNVGFNTYHCFKDITSIVQAAGANARFTVANVAARVGISNRFGGWTIVVVFKSDLQPMRTISVFNGLSNISGSNPNVDITVSGFKTPASGPVTFEVGATTVTISNMLGQVITKKYMSAGKQTINVQDLLPGAYLIQAAQKAKKFIVE